VTKKYQRLEAIRYPKPRWEWWSRLASSEHNAAILMVGLNNSGPGLSLPLSLIQDSRKNQMLSPSTKFRENLFMTLRDIQLPKIDW